MREEEVGGWSADGNVGGVKKKYAKSRVNFEFLGRGSPAPVSPRICGQQKNNETKDMADIFIQQTWTDMRR